MADTQHHVQITPVDDVDGDSDTSDQPAFKLSRRKRSKKPKKAPRGKIETRKLLAHVLQRIIDHIALKELGSFRALLRHRPDEEEIAIRSAPTPLKLPKQLVQRSPHHDLDEDSDSGPAIAQSAQEIEDWPVQLQNLAQRLVEILLLANKQEFHLFGRDYEIDSLTPPASPFGSSSPGFNNPEASPNSTSSGSFRNSPCDLPSKVDSLFDKTIYVFQNLVPLAGEVIHNVKPSQPPFALQNTVFNLACALLQTHSIDSSGNEADYMKIGVCLTTAFSGWSDGMMGRLMTFFRAYLEIVVNKMTKLLKGTNSSQPSHLAVLAVRRHDLVGDHVRSLAELRSIFPLILSCILTHITPATSSLANIYQSHQLIEFLVMSKPDLYEDIMHVIAYTNHSATRFKAISLLSTFWPKSLGHLTVGTNLPRFSYTDDIYRHESGESHLPPLRELPHEWIAWRFPQSNLNQRTSVMSMEVLSTTTNEPLQTERDIRRKTLNHMSKSQYDCLQCGKLVEGFGVKCIAAHQPAHLHCLTSVENTFQLHYKTRQGIRISQPCFSQISSSRRSSLFYEKRSDPDPSLQVPISVSFHQHRLRLVHIFTLVSCFVCRLPLWGVGEQGYKCGNCRKFVHLDCSIFSSSRQSSFGSDENHGPSCKFMDVSPIEEITLTKEVVVEHFLKTLDQDSASLSRRVSAVTSRGRGLHDDDAVSMEQVALDYAYLWLQMQMYDLGIVSGSIVITSTDKHDNADMEPALKQARFVLHDWVFGLQKILLESNTILGHDPLDDRPLLVTFAENYLSELSCEIRSTSEATLNQSGSPTSSQFVHNTLFNSMSVSDIVRRLEAICDLDPASNSRAGTFLAKHLHRAGYFERYDGCPVLTMSDLHNKTISNRSSDQTSPCLFVLPNISCVGATDMMETLLVSIEKCLNDVDLSVQEVGLILLNTRCHPSIVFTTRGIETVDDLTRKSRMRIRSMLSDRILPCLLNWVLNQTPLFHLATEQIKSKHETLRQFDSARKHKANAPSLSQFYPTPRQSDSSRRPSELTMPQKTRIPSQNMTIADWMTARAKLMDRYVCGWIDGLKCWLQEVSTGLEFSDGESTLEVFVFRSIMRLAQFEDLASKTPSGHTKTDSGLDPRPVGIFDRALRSIVSLSGQPFLDMKTKEGVLKQWLHDAIRIWPSFDDSSKHALNRTLQRLFEPSTKLGPDIETMSPQTQFHDSDGRTIMATRFDPWRPLWEALEVCEDGQRTDLDLVVGTISILADSSCRVSAKTLHEIISKIGSSELTVQQCLPLAKLLYTSSVLKNSDRMALASLSTLLLRFRPISFIIQELRAAPASDEIFSFVKYNFCTFLLNGGCDWWELQNLGMIEEPHNLKQTRQSQYTLEDDFSLACDDVLINLATSIILDMALAPLHVICTRFLSVLLTERRLHVGDLNGLIKQNAGQLTQACWRLFQPSLSLLAGIRMKLILTVVNVDPDPSHNILRALRDTSSWAERYQDMDSVINILTEACDMSLADPTKSSHMTLRFISRTLMHFVESYIWDGQESVRQKAEVLFASLNSVHLNRLAICLQAAYTKGTNDERYEIVNFAIQLHNNAPDWQIFPIQFVLGSLESADDESQTASEAKAFGVIHNLWRSLTYLGSLYVAATPISDQPSLIRIKYHIARALGFENCTLRIISPSQWRLDLGELVNQYNEADLLPIFSGLLLLLDSPHHIEVDETALLAAGLQTMSEGPKLVSSVFIDIIPRMFYSRNERVIKSWSYVLLRKSVEGIHIICSKQQLEARDIAWAEDDITIAMRGVTRLLLEDIAPDIKTLVIVTCGLFFTRFPKRVIAVLAFQVMTMLDFMTQSKPWDPHTGQVRSFLRTAFRAYGARGLFSLLWRHDMTTTIKKKSRLECLADVMIDGVDPVSPDDVLADLPIKDILRQGMKAPKEHMGAVITNLCSYIARARYSNVPLILLDSLGQFLQKLARLFVDSHEWSAEAINFDPLLNMAALLVSHNKLVHLEIFCFNLAALLRTSLCRFTVTAPAINGLLDQTISVHKIQPTAWTSFLVEALSDNLTESLQNTKVSPTSLGFVAEVLSTRASQITSVGLSFNQTQLALVTLDYLVRTEGASAAGPNSSRYTRATFEVQMNIATLGLTCGCRATTLIKTLEGIENPKTLLCILSFLLVNLPKRKDLIRQMLADSSLDRLLDMSIDVINLITAQSSLREMLAFLFATIHAWWVLLAVELPTDSRIHQERFWTGIWPAIHDVMVPIIPVDNPAIHVVLWSSFCDLVAFMQQVDAYGIQDVMAILDDQIEESDDNDPVRTKIVRTRADLAQGQPTIFLPRQSLTRELNNQLFTAVKLKKHLYEPMSEVQYAKTRPI